MTKKAYIDHENENLVTIGFDPEWAREQTLALELKSWGWIDENDRDIPDSWEVVELPA